MLISAAKNVFAVKSKDFSAIMLSIEGLSVLWWSLTLNKPFPCRFNSRQILLAHLQLDR